MGREHLFPQLYSIKREGGGIITVVPLRSAKVHDPVKNAGQGERP